MTKITTRRGKIARLPLAIRQELNTRLQNGEEGRTLVLWLNGLPAVNDVLAAQFKNKPIAECNLSEWKTGGYIDWLLLDQMAPETRASEVLDMSPDLIADVQGGLTDKMAVLLASRAITELKGHPLSSDSVAEVKLWHELRLTLSSLKRYQYFTRKEMKDEAKERAASNKQGPGRKRLTEDQKRRELSRILGLDPDRPRLNPKTDLFEGPGADALNEQRERLKIQFAGELARRAQAYKARQQPAAIGLNLT